MANQSIPSILSTVLVYTKKRYRVIGETRLGYTKIFHGILQSLCTYFADLNYILKGRNLGNLVLYQAWK